MSEFGPLTDLLDHYAVDLSDQEQRVTARVVLLWLAGADTKTELVARVRLLSAYIERISSIHQAAHAALSGEAP